MNDLPVKKVCAQCGEPFYIMPSRASKTPGTGTLCRHCRMAALDAATPTGPAQTRYPRPASDRAAGPARGGPRLYPCRICGAMSVNRFYCPEHHQQISMENSPFAEDFSFGSEEGVAARAAFMERAEPDKPEA
ncbi:hypothetical protein [Oceanidesulfovibrio marinus]|uniref:Uncharacterized protein n=1 Tax=Oceanidesulfovibrio marinus TaxID=370038 RepID=A0ABX6NJT1_9BACT|nr:hypothetical protein [Oceanidesulfovibrio marinus]QJT10906.1 hypothetical protein E8L03_19195 [Oceanidesulfovibrio marinus]